MKLISLATALQFALLSLSGVSFSAQARAGTPFCFGDSTQVLPPCPCGNNGTTLGNGCGNSLFAAGGVLSDAGNPGASALTDFLVLTASNVTGPGVFFQGTGTLFAPLTFGDGLLCVTGTIVRIGFASPTLGVATYPGLGQPQIHVMGGDVNTNIRSYQFWYRDAAPFCTSATHNVTSGVLITWLP